MRVFVAAYVCLILASCSRSNWLVPDRMVLNANTGETERIGGDYIVSDGRHEVDNFHGQHWSIGIGFEYDLKAKRVEKLPEISVSLNAIAALMREQQATSNLSQLTKAVEGVESSVTAAVKDTGVNVGRQMEDLSKAVTAAEDKQHTDMGNLTRTVEAASTRTDLNIRNLERTVATVGTQVQGVETAVGKQETKVVVNPTPVTVAAPQVTVTPQIVIPPTPVKDPVVDPHEGHGLGHDIVTFFDKLISGDGWAIIKFLVICLGIAFLLLALWRYRNYIPFLKKENKQDGKS